jgi:hypothetical protein
MTIPTNAQVSLYCLRVMILPLNLIVVAGGWALALVLPHFQTTPSATILLIDTIIICLLGLCSYGLLNSILSKSKVLKIAIVLVSIGGFVIGFIWTKLSNSQFYEIWSHFGAGTMKLNEKVFIFGDLAHLTSAAACPGLISIGTQVCDPWGRLFNQNPDVGELFRKLQFTSVDTVGLFSIFTFIIVFFYSIKFLKVETISPYVVLLSPMFILALDRGNEVMTITLVVIGIIELHGTQAASQIIGSGVLLIAVILKLWPIFLILFLLLYHWVRLKNSARVLLIISLIYWGLKVQEIKAIMEATQGGSPFGTSFGLRLFASTQLNPTQIFTLLCIAIGLTIILIKFGNLHLKEFLGSESGTEVIRWVSPIMLTYVAVWASSDSFIYRMIILLPLVLILSAKAVFEHRWSKFLISSILVTLISSRLPVTLAVSSALAIYFIYFVFKAWLAGTSTLHK